MEASTEVPTKTRTVASALHAFATFLEEHDLAPPYVTVSSYEGRVSIAVQPGSRDVLMAFKRALPDAEFTVTDRHLDINGHVGGDIAVRVYIEWDVA